MRLNDRPIGLVRAIERAPRDRRPLGPLDWLGLAALLLELFVVLALAGFIGALMGANL